MSTRTTARGMVRRGGTRRHAAHPPRHDGDAAPAMPVVVVLYVALMAPIIPLVGLGWPRPVTAEM